MADTDPDVRWMSYAEAARALGVNPESVARRMRRGNWARSKGNDGKPRVAVPVSALPVPVIVPVNVLDAVPDSADESRTIKALEGEAAALREALGRERERADKAEAAAAVVPDLRERLGRAEGESGTLREQARAERDRAEAERERAEAARAELADWMAGGPLARAWRAFVNRRGR